MRARLHIAYGTYAKVAGLLAAPWPKVTIFSFFHAMTHPVDACTAPRRYAVLYYKRKKKVHKQKGVSKEDGILVVEPPPSCKVSLFEDDGMSMHGGKNKKKSATLVTSGINWTISKKAFGVVDSKSGAGNVFELGPNGLADGDIVEMSSAALDLEITAVLDGGGGGAAAMGTTSGGATKSLGGLKKPALGGLGGGGLKKRPGGLGGGMSKGGIGLGGKAGAGNGRGLVSRKPTNPLLAGRKRPLVGLGSGTAGGTGLGRGLVGRRPPPQPKRRDDDNDNRKGNNDDEEDDDEMDGSNGMENMTEAKVNAASGRKGPLSRVPSSLLGGGGKKRRIISGRGLGATAASAGASTTSSTAAASISAADSFPGAIGTIIAPASIRGILRPHQREGVTFLWNCLTGASPDLQRVAEESGAGSAASKGAILADEMGEFHSYVFVFMLFVTCLHLYF